jgi:hypothetical protein
MELGNSTVSVLFSRNAAGQILDLNTVLRSKSWATYAFPNPTFDAQSSAAELFLFATTDICYGETIGGTACCTTLPAREGLTQGRFMLRREIAAPCVLKRKHESPRKG